MNCVVPTFKNNQRILARGISFHKSIGATMKTRFNTYDIICGVTELQGLIGMRVNQIYDIDNKTYLIRLQQSETKCVLLLESGTRFHTTSFEWPKNVAPSGFSMKLRKHLKNKRLEKVTQFGIDRIVGFQFGTGEAAYHVILELYDRGNIILADHEQTILNILRPHTEGEEVRFAVREKYPTNRAKEYGGKMSEEVLRGILETAKPGDNLRRILTPVLDCGPSVIEHILHRNDLANCCMPGDNNLEETTNENQSKKSRKQRKKDGDSSNVRQFNLETDLARLLHALNEVDDIIQNARTTPSKGYIIQKKEVKPSQCDGEEAFFYHNIEYHPALLEQNKDQSYKEFETFMAAVDEFYSTQEGQKIDLKAINQEREALKKLSNVKKDHAKRLENLTKAQEGDMQKAELITRNQVVVDNAILAMRSAIANQMSWSDIQELVKAAQANGDPVARTIKQLKLEINHITMLLQDPYRGYEQEIENDEENDDDDFLPTMLVDIDLGFSAFANARKFYDLKRNAAKKEQRTIDASQKAMKSAEKKTQQTLKEVRTISTISKARKVYWFEKFYWFISSENYLVIGGRDGQQNELIVKRYMRPSDIYVHAEIQGASSVIIRNPTGNDVPPKTLLEAGTMAISYSVAWDAKVVTNAYWVKSEQVTKTAPTGEYLTTGSFMIRGKKNFLPPCHLIMGMSLLFKLEDSSIERHRGERRVRTFDEEATVENLKQLEIENEKLESVQEEEVELDNDSDNPDTAEKSDKDKSNANSDEDESDSEPSSAQFPDTHIKIEHDTGKVTLKTDQKLESLQSPQEEKNFSIERKIEAEAEDAPYIVSSLPPRRKQMSAAKKKKQEQERKADLKLQQQKSQEEERKSNAQVKRGQRGKIKKIKSKYKDQDEEERQMRMEILKSAGPNKPSISADDNKQEEEAPTKKYPNKVHESKRQPQEDADDLDDMPANADVEMLDSLTGLPVEEDELLFAIPVVAPYQTLQNYKYKVKLTPGTGKRGKAAKTALLMFSKDRSCTQREKDLLKGIKEETLARNIPGKVKLSAPQLQKFKK